MSSMTMGVKLSDDLRARLKSGADRLGRTPHWLVKQALLSTLERIERGDELGSLFAEPSGVELSETVMPPGAPNAPSFRGPFLAFAQSVQPQSVLRARVTSAYRRPEQECLPYLIEQARQSDTERDSTRALALSLVEALRRKGRGGGAEGLLDEYSLSSQEGVALMCLAEALLRIPDAATRDALIRDKIAAGDWQAHVGHSPSMFVNAATWGLVVTGRLTATISETGLTHAVTRLIGRGGEPLIRKGVAMAMRLMGEQFVTGQTIGEALANSRKAEAKGFRFSYDMLGEAATTGEDAARYMADYERAIHAIGRASGRRGIYDGPGISIKLSALHPRYSRAQADRVMAELLPRLRQLALLARSYDIGLNIDAEESDRLEISLDLLEALCVDPELAGWNGVGFVVQAYSKRCPFVIDWLIDLAHRSRRRIMVRLVKGAYWDSEIKRAQMDGLEGFPVYTRKLHTDVSYLACARKLLAAPDAIYPQFATHNAQTLAAIHSMAGGNYYAGQYEFQCLHGMGEPLYEEVVGAARLSRPCRVYAPVGTHETLLAYLVRRLLENGANTSFVNRVADPRVQLDDLVADPVEQAAALRPVGAPHPRIALPRDLFGAERNNSAGIDLANEQRLGSLSAALLGSCGVQAHAAPMLAGAARDAAADTRTARPVLNPADHRDRIGTVTETSVDEVTHSVAAAVEASAIWSGTPATDRADTLCRAADLLEARMPALLGLIVREAGKTLPAAIAEIREAVDFLRYYAQAARPLDAATHRPLGPVACISPWNFPLAIFTGQVAAALAAGNTVLAKPAEQTPLIAGVMVALLHEAGVPRAAVQLLPGGGDIGAALVADLRVRGVVFTGSTEVARAIHRQLADRLTPAGQPIPLIAETGGQNAMIVDSSALAEQVVGDVLASAFDSAGQRCSALRVLCLQEDVADRILHMLHGALAELAVGNPDRLATDIGPVIDAEAQRGIEAYLDSMRARGFAVSQATPPPGTAHGTFVAPAIVEIGRIADLGREVFGPVLHVVRYPRAGLDALVAALNGTGYGLTFGLHTRIDETIARVTAQVTAGNVYVNRNIIGAVVGVQPFGGEGLSGTGPKAGGPLYLLRLLSRPADCTALPATGHPDPVALQFRDWLAAEGRDDLALRCAAFISRSALGAALDLPGPVGERNLYTLHPLGAVACVPQTRDGALLQIAAVLATGNQAVLHSLALSDLPAPIAARITHVADWQSATPEAVLFEGDSDHLLALNRRLAAREGAILRLQSLPSDALVSGAADYQTDWLLRERAIANNVAAAGGNASLMTIG